MIHVSPTEEYKIGYKNWKRILYKYKKKFKYLEVTITNTSGIREENERRINTGTACYYSVEKSCHMCVPKN